MVASDLYEQERDRLLKEFMDMKDTVVCTSPEHRNPMLVRATQICFECCGAACPEHEIAHDDGCPRRRVCTRR